MVSMKQSKTVGVTSNHHHQYNGFAPNNNMNYHLNQNHHQHQYQYDNGTMAPSTGMNRYDSPPHTTAIVGVGAGAGGVSAMPPPPPPHLPVTPFQNQHSQQQPILTLSVSGVDFKVIPAATFGKYNAIGGSSGVVSFQQDSFSGEMLLNLENFSGTIRVASSTTMPPSVLSTTVGNQIVQSPYHHLPTTTHPPPSVQETTRMLMMQQHQQPQYHHQAAPYYQQQRNDSSPCSYHIPLTADNKNTKPDIETRTKPKKSRTISAVSARPTTKEDTEPQPINESVVDAERNSSEFANADNSNKRARFVETEPVEFENTAVSESLSGKSFPSTQNVGTSQSQSLLVDDDVLISIAKQVVASQTLQQPSQANTIVDSDDDDDAPNKTNIESGKENMILHESSSSTNNNMSNDDEETESLAAGLFGTELDNASLSSGMRGPNIVGDDSPSDACYALETCTQHAESSPVTATPEKGKEPPNPRWGHTLTHVGEDRLIMYGGQGFDPKTNLPAAMSDLNVYDFKKNVWFKPFNCDNIARQWHTCNYLPERNLIVCYGGETPNKTGKTTKITDSTMVLDTELMLWYPPTITGDNPGGRSGHTASLLSKTNELIIFGGIGMGKRWLNSVVVLDTTRWAWTTPRIFGDAPKPRTYHIAVPISTNDFSRIVYFGGNNATESFNSVHVLEVVPSDYQDDGAVVTAWKTISNSSTTGKSGSNTVPGSSFVWKHPTVTGTVPTPRTGMTATLLPDNKTIAVYGGWDPNMEDEESQDVINNDFEIIFDETYLLDTETWTWSLGPSIYHDVNTNCVNGYSGGRRVGHDAILITKHKATDSSLDNSCINNDIDINDNKNESVQSGNEKENDSILQDHSVEGVMKNDNGETVSESEHDTNKGNQPCTSEILIFGGRIPGDQFCSDFKLIKITTCN